MERPFVRDLFGPAVGDDAAGVDAGRQPVQVFAPGTEQRGQRFDPLGADVAHRAKARAVQFLLADRPDTPQPRHGQRVEEVEHRAGGDFDEAVGLVEVAGDLRDELDRRHADRGGQIQFLSDRGFDLTSDVGGVAEQLDGAADVEKRFVDRQRLDDGGEAVKDLADLTTDGDVVVHAGPDEHGVGAEFFGASPTHRAADAEATRLVRRRLNDAPAAAAPADDDGFAAECRVIPLFD